MRSSAAYNYLPHEPSVAHDLPDLLRALNGPSRMTARQRVLSGIQPTGPFHWGNYFGAIRQYIDLQHDHEGYYFIADLHALTTVRDPALLRKYVRDAALDLLALGLDPQQATLFVQSDVPEVSELCWILMTGAPMGLLERCHAYKDKKARGLNADAGLFTYPVLMSADILMYDAHLVPVGEDQVQHIEVCRDLAGAFNHQFGETFVLPKAKVMADGARVPGTDGEKMSKSYNNTLPIFGDEKAIRKQIMRITTDSRLPDQPKDPDTDHLYALYRLFASESETATLAETYRRGGFGYGDVKKLLADASEAFFAPARQRRRSLEQQPQWVDDVLADGAARARKKASEVLGRVQRACGIRAVAAPPSGR
jgi:tryptophanyl-tRNA synthetase